MACASFWNSRETVPRNFEVRRLFEMFADRPGHLKHIQLFGAENRLQLVVGEDFTFVLRVLQFVFPDMGPDLFRDLGTGKRVAADDLRQLL